MIEIPSIRRTIGLIINFPRIVCLCGSTRFMEAFQAANLAETVKGNIVLSVGCNTKTDADLFGDQFDKTELKRLLDELHKRKIDLCDEILVLNVDGYIGESTANPEYWALRQILNAVSPKP